MKERDVSTLRQSWWHGSVTPAKWMREFRHLMKRFETVSNLEGDVIECGVGEGQTFSMLAYLVGSEGREPSRTLWGFDSFKGWPKPSAYDQSPREPEEGEWKVSQRVVKKRLKDAQIHELYPDIDIRIVKGFLKNTLPKKFPKDGKIALLHIDTDLYEGYKNSLEYLFPKVSRGGIICFDEYREFPERAPYNSEIAKWPGCDRAVDDFLKTISGQFKLNQDKEAKKYFLIKK